MEKFVKNDCVIARRRSRRGDLLKDCFVASLVVITSIFFAGCASVQAPGYISRADHPYERKFNAGFEKVTSAFDYVLKAQGWSIVNELDAAVYERDDRYDNNGYQNLVIITDDKKHFLHWARVHLNVFIHSIANNSEVEIRFSSGRDNRAAQAILDAVGQEVNQ